MDSDTEARATANVPGAGAPFAERLRWAIERQPRQGRRRGMKLFQRRMAETARARGGGGRRPGVALSTIQGYLSGAVEPPLAWIAEAADVLGVRRGWLLTGEGWPTLEEERAAPGVLAAHGARMLADWGALDRAEDEALSSSFAGYGYLPHAVRAGLLRTLGTYQEYLFGQSGALDARSAAERFGRYLQGAVDLLGFEPASISPVDWALIMSSLFVPVTVALESQRHGEDPDAQA